MTVSRDTRTEASPQVTPIPVDAAITRSPDLLVLADAGRHRVVADARRIVIKVGSSLVTDEGRGLDRVAISRWGNEIAALCAQGKQVVVVSSGAVAEGMKRLGWSRRPREMHELQAAAAVGQMGLAQVYESCFSEHGLRTAQVLLTHEDLADRRRYLNARSTLRTLIELSVIPIINENDTVVTDEIKFGDNDTLGALVTNLIDADALVILTDQQGLYTADPRRDPSAQLLPAVRAVDPRLEAIAGGTGSSIAKGGMITKVRAAQRAARGGANTVVASGRLEGVLPRLAAGEPLGTQFIADIPRLAARKQWMADHLQLRGAVTIDDGAVRALKTDGRSLLPIGVVEVQGDYERGEVIAIRNRHGEELGRGLSNYSSADTRRIMRHPSSEIESILGYIEEPELIHRDDLVLR
jgi:glutamate 5-kinase